MMAIPTLVVGLLPGFAQIGWLATIILLLSRVIQGIAVSGAGPGSLVYICEMAPKDWRTVMATSIEIPGGTALASLAASLVRKWRLLFQNQKSTRMFSKIIRPGPCNLDYEHRRDIF